MDINPSNPQKKHSRNIYKTDRETKRIYTYNESEHSKIDKNVLIEIEIERECLCEIEIERE